MRKIIFILSIFTISVANADPGDVYSQQFFDNSSITIFYGALYASSNTLNNEEDIGSEAGLHIMLDESIGIGFNYFNALINATDVVNTPTGSTLQWENNVAVLSLFKDFSAESKYVSTIFEGGIGLSKSELIYFIDKDDEVGEPQGEKSNLSFLAKLDIVIAKPHWRLEPYLSISYLRFNEPIQFTNNSFESDVGDELWGAVIGIRWRITKNK